jgi:hypothetical protein
MSMGSQSGNRHVHWHVASLPPGVPYEEQQFAAFSWKRGVVALPDDDMADLARRIQGVRAPGPEGDRVAGALRGGSPPCVDSVIVNQMP